VVVDAVAVSGEASDPEACSAGALAQDPAAGSRIIRWLEDGDPRGVGALRKLYPARGRAYLLGITGPSGAGKSTLVDALIAELRSRDFRVGVLAIDPTSPFSGGAILGDRVRMQRHAADPGVFIRSMATRGQLGGLARTTYEASIVLDAMGYEMVLIETVGVGQDELDVAGLAHTTAVVSVPGLGDDVQAIKAGILEIGDLHVINKSDRPGADETERHLRTLLQLRGDAERARGSGWEPRLLRTVATREQGIVELVDACLAHREHLRSSGTLAAREGARDERFLLDLLGARARGRLLGQAASASVLEACRSGELDPYTAVDRILAAAGLAEPAE
jgi:LAO/AO transport system kinase